MNLGDNFENKLIKLIEKYGKREEKILEQNLIDSDQEIDGDDDDRYLSYYLFLIN